MAATMAGCELPERDTQIRGGSGKAFPRDRQVNWASSPRRHQPGHGRVVWECCGQREHFKRLQEWKSKIPYEKGKNLWVKRISRGIDSDRARGWVHWDYDLLDLQGGGWGKDVRFWTPTLTADRERGSILEAVTIIQMGTHEGLN